MDKTEHIFEGLKVVEVANVLAGPAVGMFFSELGAEVIKIENKTTGGDLTRKWKLPGEKTENQFSSYYHSVNYRKEIVFLDLRAEDDSKTALELVSTADILITNFKKGDADKFGFNYSLLLQRYPSLILAEVTGFDDEDRVAYDAVLQAESGLMSINGRPGDEPLKLPVAFIDLFAAHQLKEGILIALLQRMKNGKGSRVSVSLYAAALSSLANQASAFLNTGLVPEAIGSLHPTIAPYGEVFVCKDGQRVLLAVGTDDQFFRLLKILGLEQYASDPMYSTNKSRVIHRGRLEEILKRHIAPLNAEDFLNACHRAGVPAGAVLSLDRVFEKEAAKSMILQQQEIDGTISKRVATIAFKITSHD